MHIYIFDRQVSYLANLAQMIHLYFPDCTIHTSKDFISFPASQTQRNTPIICLFNSIDFPELDQQLTKPGKFPDTLNQLGDQSVKTVTSLCHYIRLSVKESSGSDRQYLSKSNQDFELKAQADKESKKNGSLINSQDREAASKAAVSVQTLPRTGNLNILLLSILNISQIYRQNKESLNEPQIYSSINLNIKPEANQMVCCLSFAGTSINKWITSLLNKSIKHGYRTVYLPLMPPYEQFLPLKPDSGPDLSDLLYRISVQADSENKISHFWQSAEKGWLQFRPPVRSDDLLCCHPETIKTLVSSLKQKMSPETGKSYVLIDCRHIPFSFVLTAAALCSYLYIQLPFGQNQAIRAAEREAAHLANQLPGTCKVIFNKMNSPTGSADINHLSAYPYNHKQDNPQYSS